MTQSDRRRRMLIGAAPIIIATLVAYGLSSSPSTAATSSTNAATYAEPGVDSGCPSKACSIELAAVASSARLKTLPTDLTPTLTQAPTDLEIPPGGVPGSLGIPGLSPLYEPFVYGSSSATSRIVLIGDSHAWQWSTAVASIAQQDGAQFGLVFHAGCYVTLTASSLGLNGLPGAVPSGKTCDQWTEAAIKWINGFKPTTVIVVGYENNTVSTQAIYRAGLVKLFDEIQSPGRHLVLLGPGPYNLNWLQAGAPCLARHESDVQACAAPEPEEVFPFVIRTMQQVADQVHARYVNVIPWLCTTAECPEVIGKYEVYEDPYHLTSTFAASLSPVLGIALGLMPANDTGGTTTTTTTTTTP